VAYLMVKDVSNDNQYAKIQRAIQVFVDEYDRYPTDIMVLVPELSEVEGIQLHAADYLKPYDIWVGEL
jgi:hypothetical protein